MNQPKQPRTVIRRKNYSPRTEQAYWNWIKQFSLSLSLSHIVNATRTK